MSENINESTEQPNTADTTPQEKKQPNKKQTQNLVASFSLGVIGGIIGAGIFLTAMPLIKEHPTISPETKLETPTKVISSSAEDTAVTAAVDKIQNAVVSIANYQSVSNDSTFDLFGKNNKNKNNIQKTGEGSGVIYKSEEKFAYIVTNHHVVKNAIELKVTLKDGTIIPAQLVGEDELTDLAVLKIDSKSIKSVAKFANSDEIRVGQTALAVGSPLGTEFASTVTKGIISAVNRLIESDSTGFVKETIQTDAAINPGNSGGALVDLNGNVIGINSLKISKEGIEGLGFAIPSNQVVNIINALEKDGKVIRPYLGVGLVSLSDIPEESQKEFLKLPENITSGVIITKVDPNSSADKAGLKQYDIILSVNGVKVGNLNTFRKELYKHKLNDKIELDIYRDGKQQKISATLQNNQKK